MSQHRTLHPYFTTAYGIFLPPYFHDTTEVSAFCFACQRPDDFSWHPRVGDVA